MGDKLKVVRCPKCGYEYLPAEVFLPEDILGKPEHIIRTPSGGINFYTGHEPEPITEWTCDQCETVFTVKADLSIDVELKGEHDFSEDFESNIYKDRITLEESKLFDD